MNLATVAGSITYTPTVDLSITAGALHESINLALSARTSVVARRTDDLVEYFFGAITDAARAGVSARSEAVSRAYFLLRAMPTNLPLPTVIVEEDGDVALDWDLGQRRVVTVTVSDGPTLRYASQIGAETAYGRVPYSGEAPSTIVRLVQRVSA